MLEEKSNRSQKLALWLRHQWMHTLPFNIKQNKAGNQRGPQKVTVHMNPKADN